MGEVPGTFGWLVRNNPETFLSIVQWFLTLSVREVMVGVYDEIT